MADYLASIFGTEKDKVNCSFYFKIGACRHGEKCSKVHNKPTFSQTVLLKNMYVNPLSTTVYTYDHKLVDPNNHELLQKHFDDIFDELFIEMEAKYGEIEEMNICDNLSEHLAGNTYVKFRYEEDAEKACQDLNNRWFNGRPVWAELSPVTDFHEACCRQYQMGECPRGGFCNFMHLKPISNTLRRKLYTVKYSRKKKSMDDLNEYDSDEYSNTFNGNGYGNEFTMGGYTRDGLTRDSYIRRDSRDRSPPPNKFHRSHSRSPIGDRRRGGGGGGSGGHNSRGSRRY